MATKKNKRDNDKDYHRPDEVLNGHIKQKNQIKKQQQLNLNNSFFFSYQKRIIDHFIPRMCALYKKQRRTILCPKQVLGAEQITVINESACQPTKEVHSSYITCDWIAIFTRVLNE